MIVPLVAWLQAVDHAQGLATEQLEPLPLGLITLTLEPLDSGMRGGRAVPRELGVPGGGGAVETTAVAAEVAVADPAPFVAATLTRIVEPASPEPSR